MCLCLGSPALLCVSHLTPKSFVPRLSVYSVYSALCPHVLSGGLNWGIRSPSLLQGHLGGKGQAPELLVGHLSVAEVQLLNVTFP